MRICVVVPTGNHLETAGVRIRYQRIAAHLEAMGHSFSLQIIDDLQLRPKPDCDVVLISKCYDARGIVAAAEMRAQGVQVGADFFDDYYSQVTDSRFVHLRQWLRDISGSLSFTLCSTPLMRRNLAELVPHVPCHMMNDPYKEFDTERVAEQVEAKLRRVRATGIIDIGWFGIGDNPHFAVGLSDLGAYAGMLADLSRHGLSPRLSILTNRRALGIDRLQMLGRLPVPWRIEEWNEDAEHRLIAGSYACFLPVNAQRFSIVKSLNRAVTTLTGGAQVLSAGYPLYDAFGDFVYRGAADLAADIAASKPRLRRTTLPAFLSLMETSASPRTEAAGLAAFLQGLAMPQAVPGHASVAILHGRTSIAAVHKFAQRRGYLSVAGFKAGPELNYDIKPCLAPGTGRPSVQLSPPAMRMLKPDLAAKAVLNIAANGRQAHYLPLPDELAAMTERGAGLVPDSDALFLSDYEADLADLPRLVSHFCAGVRVVLSEPASPYWSSAAAARGAA
ncbi:hypothetical protein [Aestuariivirga sp.]|uniref:hypothetical protein n=1 Tax=Aestuariivirga sp. TaxID=2650926 RepID=UPI003593E167